jgi:hypothetical protein
LRHFPYSSLVKFLISTKAELAPSLRKLELPYPDFQEASAIKAALMASAQPPVVEAWFRSSAVPVQGSEAFLAWTAVHGIKELWERRLGARDENLEAACRAFSNPGIRTVLATLLMTEFDPIEIQEVLYSRYRVKISTEAVELFGSIFWETRSMSHHDWALLFDELDKDQRSMLSVAFSGLGKDGVRLALGIVPEVDLSAILGDVAATAFSRYKQELDKAGPDDDTAMKWAKVAIAAAEKKKRFGGGASRSLADEVQMQLAHDQGRIPTLAEVSGSDKPPK